MLESPFNKGTPCEYLILPFLLSLWNNKISVEIKCCLFLGCAFVHFLAVFKGAVCNVVCNIVFRRLNILSPMANK